MTARLAACSLIPLIALATGVLHSTSQARAEDASLRQSAVLDLSFDEPEGAAEDRAGSGGANDSAQPMNAPSRIASPFWNMQDGLAAKLDASQTQFFQIADSPDLDHAAGSTLSFFLLNLHDPADTAFHGIAAKRSGGEQKTNYGFNFQPASKRLQVYIHDGTAYKVVGFPIDSSIGYRKLVHLTATFRPGDAPAPDEDTENDDLEIKLYINGKPLKPLDATGGPVLEDAGWITDVNFQGLLNDAPLTIGSSFPNGELFSGLIDEFLLFNRPLTGDEASRLFLEVAGAEGEVLAKRESETPATLAPVLADISPRGVQLGVTTRVTITGQNLVPAPTVTLLGKPLEDCQIIEAAADRIVADLTISAEHSPSLLPIAVRTPNGISAPLPLPADRLPQRMQGELSDGRPAELPAAYTGVLNGADQHRFIIEGKAGQSFIAEVELKRLGGTADPVLELKTEANTPLDVAWGRSQRRGDPRLVTTFPADGRYVLELHDLAYKAPRSPFRLLMGDLTLIDTVIPPAAASTGPSRAHAIGVGIAEQSLEIAASIDSAPASISGVASKNAHGVLPEPWTSDGREFSEADATNETLDLTSSNETTYITGQLLEPGETDRFSVQVKAGQELQLRAEAKLLGSVVEPVVTVLQDGERLGRAAAKPGEGLASLAITPKSDGLVQIEISDRMRGQGPDRLYRLRVAPTGTPELSVTALDGSIVIPSTGRGVTRLRIERSSNIGEVRLIADPAAGVELEPAVIAAGPSQQVVFVTVKASGDRSVGATLRITAEADSPPGIVRREVQTSPGGLLTGFDASRRYHEIPIVPSEAAPAIEFVKLPAAAFKGVTETFGVQIVGEIPRGRVVRFSLISDEPVRPLDPNNAAAGNKPLIRVSQDSTLGPGASSAVIPLEVPVDLAIAELQAVVKAEVVPHAWSNRVEAIGYSAPFRLMVQEPVVSANATTAVVLKTGENSVPIVIERHPGFSQPVRIEVRGLPAGVTAAAGELPSSDAEVPVTIMVPEGTPAGAVADAKLVVLGSAGVELKTVTPFPIEIQP